MIETLNGKITSADIFVEDHGIWTSVVHIDHENGSQGFGCYFLSGESMRLWIVGVCQVLGVDAWSKVAGKHCRVMCDYGKIHALGNIIKDEWLHFESLLKTTKADDQGHRKATVELLKKQDIQLPK
jgi:hypothetical protein